MTKYTARFERFTKNTGVVEMEDGRGCWEGSYRVWVGKSGRSLYELAYETANREATVKGGRLERFMEVD